MDKRPVCKSKLSDIYTLGSLQTNHKSKEECSYSPNSTISRASSRFNLPTSPKLMQQTWSKSNSEEPLPFLNPAKIACGREESWYSHDHIWAMDSLWRSLCPQWPPAFRPLQAFMPGRQPLFTQPVQAALLSLLMHWFMHLSREHSTNLAMQLAQPSE